MKEVLTMYPTMQHQLNYRAPLALILFNATLYKFIKMSARSRIVFHLQRLQLRIEVVIASFSSIFRTSRVSKTAMQ